MESRSLFNTLSQILSANPQIPHRSWLAYVLTYMTLIILLQVNLTHHACVGQDFKSCSYQIEENLVC